MCKRCQEPTKGTYVCEGCKAEGFRKCRNCYGAGSTQVGVSPLADTGAEYLMPRDRTMCTSCFGLGYLGPGIIDGMETGA